MSMNMERSLFLIFHAPGCGTTTTESATLETAAVAQQITALTLSSSVGHACGTAKTDSETESCAQQQRQMDSKAKCRCLRLLRQCCATGLVSGNVTSTNVFF